MGLIKKAIKRIDFDNRNYYSDYTVPIQDCIKGLKSSIGILSKIKSHTFTEVSDKKSIKEYKDKAIFDIEYYLKHLDDKYDYFLRVLSEYNSMTKIYAQDPSFKQEVKHMLQFKKEFRVEFEKIYNNFKRISKGYDYPGRKEILGMMRRVFDFDSSKYNEISLQQ